MLEHIHSSAKKRAINDCERKHVQNYIVILLSFSKRPQRYACTVHIDAAWPTEVTMKKPNLLQ